MNDFEDFKYKCFKCAEIPQRSFGPSAPAPPCKGSSNFPVLIPVLGSLKQGFSGVNPESPGEPEASLLLWGEVEGGFQRQLCPITDSSTAPKPLAATVWKSLIAVEWGPSVVNLFDHATEVRQTRTFILYLSRNGFWLGL